MNTRREVVSGQQQTDFAQDRMWKRVLCGELLDVTNPVGARAVRLIPTMTVRHHLVDGGGVAILLHSAGSEMGLEQGGLLPRARAVCWVGDTGGWGGWSAVVALRHNNQRVLVNCVQSLCRHSGNSESCQ